MTHIQYHIFAEIRRNSIFYQILCQGNGYSTDISIKAIEKEHKIDHSLVAAWVKKYLEEGEEALEPHNGNPYAALHTSKSLSEVERLKLMVAKLEVENARLKKGYWVEGVGASKEYVTGCEKTTKSSKISK